MNVTIAIPTYNRADYLRLTLESLIKLKSVGGVTVDVLVVDNGCTDNTAEVVEQYLERLQGRLRLVKEPSQGLSHARNRAIADSGADVLAYLDDDVEVDPDWLQAMLGAFAAESCAVVGGKTDLIYPTERPRWLGPRSEGLLSKLDRGACRKRVGPDGIFGGNIAFRMEWLYRIGPFRVDLGRIGSKLISSEEEELLERMAGAGGELMYEPRMLIGHRVHPNRLRRRWFWSRSYWGARGDARRLASGQISGFGLVRATARLIRFGWAMVKAAVLAGPGSEECFFRSRQVASRWGDWVGMLIELRRGSLGRSAALVPR